MRHMFKDPVCNMMVDEKKTKFVSESGGRKVYLCSEACKSQSMPTQTNTATESPQNWHIEEERKKK
jgi:YHS domain-containing protein